MISRADPGGARAISAIPSVAPARPVATAPDAGRELQNQLSRYSLGQRFQAQILARLDDGSSIVELGAGLPVRMTLPDNLHPGDRLTLALLSAGVRPSFLLAENGTDTPAAAHTSLSDTGKLIDQLLRATQQRGTAPVLVAKTPVVTTPGADPTQLAIALKDALTSSGLFYESHLAQWAEGERPLPDLLREPQGAWSSPALLASVSPDALADDAPMPALPAPVPEAAKHAAQADLTTAGTPQTRDQKTAPMSESANDGSTAETARPPSSLSQEAGMAGLAGAADVNSSGAHVPLDDAAMQMVGLQLNALEQQKVSWHGELWPGRSLEWEVGRDAPGTGQAGDERERAWHSTVRFELPALGPVAASIRLFNGRVQVQMRAAEEAAAVALRAHGDALALALGDAGSPLDLLTVRRDDAV
jgi:hypothetical protein